MGYSIIKVMGPILKRTGVLKRLRGIQKINTTCGLLNCVTRAASISAKNEE